MVNNRTRGFTLLELVITVGVLVILMLGVLSGTNVAMKSRTYSRERDLAREAIRARLEAIADAPLATVPAMNNQQFNVPNPADLPVGVTGLDKLRSSISGQLPGRVTVDTTTAPAGDYSNPPDGAPDLVWVRVEINWLGADGRPYRVEGGTYLSDRD